MGVTPLDLYRLGDAQGAALDNARIGVDVRVYDVNGVDWVIAENTGVSVRNVMQRLRRGSPSRWWLLPAGTQFPDVLSLFADHGNHLMFVPIRDMPYADYIDALAVVSLGFR